MKGGYRLLLDARAQSQARALYSGEYDRQNIEIIGRLMRPGGMVIDVGANIGFYTVPLAARARELGGRVAAFEPLQQNFDRLSQNVALNRLDDAVVLHQLGLADRAGTATLTLREDFDEGASAGNAAILIEDGRDVSFQSVQIQIARLDEIWPVSARVDFIKVDVEGHEDLFLLGARATLIRFRPAIQVEVCRGYYSRRGMDLDRLLPSLMPQNYVIFRIRPPSMHALMPHLRGKLKKVSDLSTVPELTDVFLIPEERVRSLTT